MEYIGKFVRLIPGKHSKRFDPWVGRVLAVREVFDTLEFRVDCYPWIDTPFWLRASDFTTVENPLQNRWRHC